MSNPGTAQLLMLTLCLACTPPAPAPDSQDTKTDAVAPDTGKSDPKTPDTGKPDTTTPDTTTPDTTAPDSTAPDADTADSTPPDSVALDTATSDTTTPDSAAPDTTTPDTAALDTTTPDTAALDATAPDSSATDAASPDAGPSAAPTQLTHPLATAADVVQLLNLHQLAATTSLQIASRLFKLGGPACPGSLDTTPQLVSADLAKPCTLTKGSATLTLAGRLAFSQPNVCKGSKATTSTITAEAFSLTGAVGSTPVSIGYDLSYTATPQGATWSGRARTTSLPSSWIPSTHAILEGTDLQGWAVSTQGSAATGRTLSGTYDLVGAGVAKLVTDQPLVSGAMAQGCFKPTSGQLRLSGAVEVVITFAGKGSCADPTWTRAGKAMGSLKIPFWSTLTICGSAGGP